MKIPIRDSAQDCGRFFYDLTKISNRNGTSPPFNCACITLWEPEELPTNKLNFTDLQSS